VKKAVIPLAAVALLGATAACVRQLAVTGPDSPAPNFPQANQSNRGREPAVTATRSQDRAASTPVTAGPARAFAAGSGSIASPVFPLSPAATSPVANHAAPAPAPARPSHTSPARSTAEAGGPLTGNPTLVAGLPDRPASGNAYAAEPAELIVELDRGVQLPAALVEDDALLTPDGATVKEKIANEFERQIGGAASDPAALERAWQDARAKANLEYQMFFGGEAANRAGITAAMEALAAP
jgi:hypothetical protein